MHKKMDKKVNEETSKKMNEEKNEEMNEEMYEKIDEELRLLARSSEIPLPAGYEQYIESVLWRIFSEKKRLRRRYVWKTVAASAVFIVLCVSTSMIKSRLGTNQRMEEMLSSEIAEYNFIETKSTANADSYYREFTIEEEERLAKLEEAYEQEGMFPERQLSIVDSKNEVKLESTCFIIADSMFYFPDRELKDEELLEYIDFCRKRDYSINKAWAESSENAEESYISYLDEVTAREKAVEAISKIYGVNISDYDYNIETVESQNVSDGEIYRLELGGNGIAEYIVTLNIADGTLMAVESLEEDAYVDGMEIDEISYKDIYCQVSDLLEKNFNFSKSDIVKADCWYRTEADGTLRSGAVTYVIQMRDGSGYEVHYGFGGEVFISFCRYIQYSTYQEYMQYRMEAAENQGLENHILELQ